MNLSLAGKKAVVCGSTQGIGKAAAEELALLGAGLLLIARNEEALKATVAGLPVTDGQKHQYLVADFSHPDELLNKLTEHLNAGNQYEILVNNTGGPPGGSIINAKIVEFEQAFRNHLVCNHILTTALLEGMKNSGYGRIINIISTSVKQPLKGLGVSNTIRAAVANWSKTLASEVAVWGITVNNVLPGATRTQRLESIIEKKAGNTNSSIAETEVEMLAEIPAGRFADPSEIGAVVAFLASPAAAYINGINVPVDGGRTGCL